MEFYLRRELRAALLAAAAAAGLSAAPRLTLLQNALPKITVGQGTNTSTTVDAKNLGDGSLNLAGERVGHLACPDCRRGARLYGRQWTLLPAGEYRAEYVGARAGTVRRPGDCV